MWKEIVWSLDPYQKDLRVWNHAASISDFIAKKSGAKVEPVYVSTPSELRIMTSYEIPAHKRMHEVSKTAVMRSLKKTRVTNLKKPQIIIDRHAFSTTEAVKVLSRYVDRLNAALMIVGTHSKTGLERFFLGSFAETLLYHAKTPVLLVGPKMRKKAAIKKILFATDFSEESKRVYRLLLQFAAEIGASVEIAHFVEDTSKFVNPFDSLMVGEESFLLANALKVQLKASKSKISKWASDAKGLRVKTKTYVEKTMDRAGDAILRRAKASGADLIAVGSQSGPVRASLGSVARHIVRKSELPVWIAPRYA